MGGLRTNARAQPDMPAYALIFRPTGFVPAFLALSISTWGDYIARIAVALVVRERTGSDLAMAATFAASLLPSILGRSLLSPLADLGAGQSVPGHRCGVRISASEDIAAVAHHACHRAIVCNELADLNSGLQTHRLVSK